MRSLPQSPVTRTLASKLGKLVKQEHFALKSELFVLPLHLEASYHAGEDTHQVSGPASAQLGSHEVYLVR